VLSTSMRLVRNPHAAEVAEVADEVEADEVALAAEIGVEAVIDGYLRQRILYLLPLFDKHSP